MIDAPDARILSILQAGARTPNAGIATIRSTRTTIVLSTVKEAGRLPIPGVAND